MSLPLSAAEAIRVCVLGLLNLCYVGRQLPVLWRLIPILPIRKPNKSASDIAGHRPISLFAALLKVFDKLLFIRLWPTIASQVSPWQGGGILGADVVGWLVSQIFEARRPPRCSTSTIAGFVDGESAFCRPPVAIVIQAMLRLAAFSDDDILAVQAFLSRLHGVALILGGAHGHWQAECGLPQGGALSTALFVLLLIQLHDSLVERRCCIHIQKPDGTVLPVALIAFIDDLLTLAESPRQFQIAMDTIYAWARKIRMKLNVGPDKTAAMIINKTGLEPASTKWRLGDVELPVVSTYRYLGLLIHNKGSWDPWLNQLKTKTDQRTMELVRWARANHITIDVLSRLWNIYVETGAAWGMAIATLSGPQGETLDKAQRKAARRILGHIGTSPLPTPCLELGWQPWSSRSSVYRLRLLARLEQTTNPLVASLLSISQALPTTWASSAEAHLSASLLLRARPDTAAAWTNHLKHWEHVKRQADAGDLIQRSQAHPNLAHYSPHQSEFPSSLTVNPVIHDHTINDAMSRTISRLMCGGQGLNGGDPTIPTEVSMRKACRFCLSYGRPTIESLTHFLHECPLTATARQTAAAKTCWERPADITRLHLSVWSHRELKTIRKTILQMYRLRQNFNQEQRSDS